MDITKSNQGVDPAGAEVLAEFRSTKTRRERCDAKMARLIAQPYDPSRKPERDARLKLCMMLLKESLERDYYDRVESEINAAYRDLAPMVNALPAPDPMERIRPAAIRAGWHGAEIDVLKGFIRQGRKIGRVTWKGVEVDGGMITREKIRDLTRPAWTRQPGANFDEEKWRESWPPIREVRVDEYGDSVFVEQG
jgi:hypothetical protein